MKTGRNESCPCGSGKKYKYCCLNKKGEEPFILTKEVYEKDFLPVYNIDKCYPKTFVEFDIVLPFHIPMYISQTFTCGMEFGYLSFRFDMITTNDSYRYPLGKNIPTLNIHKTKILMMGAVDLDYETVLGDSEKYYNEFFDLLLEQLNKIVLSYMVSKKDEDCHYLTKEMFPATIMVRTTNLETWENDMGLFMLHMNVPYEKNPLTEDEIYNFKRLQGIVVWEKNPFVAGEQHMFSARRNFKQGFYMEAVNLAQTSVEVLIRILYKELLIDEGKTEVEIEEVLENTAFMNIIKKKLASYIGGSWDITKVDTEVGKWYKNTYLLRNKVTHTGKIPSFKEVDEAIYDAIEFKKFIISRVKLNKKKYPKINEYFA
ncbi:hypothetical protein J2Z76_003052 [Sedimentibacter acidaminivorans]|uniref:SEC-C motif-containing protein n=1 Tax=Sedimentibacter acidaminivorans TaxID=913099 RepID=A0ABS4GHK2_9FIRM|nr:SEC-C metal-binding domain-containing protein [Sedimentibacter acidaminivorans]MBP1927179.1 hypothetical protein [Sedimentibacter acidaminivorans]